MQKLAYVSKHEINKKIKSFWEKKLFWELKYNMQNYYIYVSKHEKNIKYFLEKKLLFLIYIITADIVY